MQFAVAPNLADTIDSIYIAVEPWVEYGFEVATAVVRWIPYVGWFAGLIMDGYFFVEGLVASGVFNFTDWLRGNGSVVENLVDFGIDVGLAFVWLGLDALNSFIPLPPFCCYPPRPPAQGPFLASTMAWTRRRRSKGPCCRLRPRRWTRSKASPKKTSSPKRTSSPKNSSPKTTSSPKKRHRRRDVTEEVRRGTATEVTDTEVTTPIRRRRIRSEHVEAQGEIRGPDVDVSIDEDAERKAEDGAEGANGADGVDGADAEVETAEDTDDPTETTDATTADPDTGEATTTAVRSSSQPFK